MASAKELIELTQTVKIDEFVSYLNSLVRRPEGVTGNSLTCAVCQADEWIMLPYPGDNSRPIVVSHPIPFSQNQAVWYFTMNCRNCGYTMFFDAQVATKAIVDRRSK